MTNKLFVWGLPWKVRWQNLKEIFSQFGEVVYAKVVLDRDTWKSKWFGFVEFANEDDAVKAQEAMHDSEIEGRKIKVDFATDKQEGGNDNN